MNNVLFGLQKSEPIYTPRTSDFFVAAVLSSSCCCNSGMYKFHCLADINAHTQTGLSLGVVWFFMVRTGLPSETAGTAKKTPPTIQRLDLPAPMSVDFEMEDMHAAEPDDSIV
eukprot:m.101811 g.101811  ORF g.101811 m.101811 type:complete len:113 (-) comp16817_c0_seq9:96-434(-)